MMSGTVDNTNGRSILTEESILNLKSFVRRYKEQEALLTGFKVQHTLSQFRHFLNSFSQIDRLALKLIENEAPKYNLFHILNIKHLEAKVHTPFLAHLLRPGETHRQGTLFFDAFMKQLFGNSFVSGYVSSIQVKEEVSDSDNGRMDIFIFYKEKGVEKAIVIENKVYHHDEPKQLERYYKILTETYRFKSGRFHMVYLTPKGEKPSDVSISKELYNQLKKQSALTELGYRNDIAPMFISTLPFIKAPVVKETIEQYIKTIKIL